MNPYLYVEANPIRWADELGLVKWKGTYYGWGAGHRVFSKGWFVFTLTSDCVKGKQAFVRVRANGSGAGAGFSPITNTGGSVEFEDGLDYVDPHVFDGEFATMYGGAAAGIGYGWSAYRLGGAVSSFSGAPQAGFDPGSIYELYGTSRVVGIGGPWNCGNCTE